MSMVLDKKRENNKLHTDVHRAEIWMCDITGVEGNIQSGIRPCLIVSNSIGNRFSNIVVITPISSSTTKKKLPTHVELLPSQTGLIKPSILLTEQVRTIDQWCLMYKIGDVDNETMLKVDKAMAISLGLDYLFHK